MSALQTTQALSAWYLDQKWCDWEQNVSFCINELGVSSYPDSKQKKKNKEKKGGTQCL